jgi:hypothetical protein
MRRNTPYKLFLAFVIVVAATGCRGFDDDNDYAIYTRAGFFLRENPNNGVLSLYRHVDSLLEASWNTKAGISDADLSDAEMVDNVIWIASGPQNAIYQVSPTYASVKERFADLPLAPHFIAVGEQQVMVSDTANRKLAFIKRRNGKVQEVAFEGKPGKCLYNGGKFYLQVDDSILAIYDEKALTTRATIPTAYPIDEILLDSYHNVLIESHDSTLYYEGLISTNADYLVNTLFRVNYNKLRPTPYFSKRFGKEYLFDLQLWGRRLIDERGNVLADSADDFEADFFEGELFYKLHDTLFKKNMASGTITSQLPFSGKLVKSFFQYAGE